MENNIPQADLQHLCDFIIQNPILTNGEKVKEFERQWSEWLGVKHSVYVNSGGNGNLIAMLVLKQQLIEDGHDENDLGEVIISPLNWITDISSVLLCGFTPVFVDIDPDTLSMDNEKVLEAINENTRIVSMTHLMGFDGLTDPLIHTCRKRNILLLEDCCESHGAMHHDGRIGSIGDMSIFSFYYGHHITTIEGGMVCTNSDSLYEKLKMFRSHGLVRECSDKQLQEHYYEINPEPAPEFVFAYPGFNFRGTEIGAVLGVRQMAHLDNNIEIRKRNFELFLSLLDDTKYKTDYKIEGNSNFGLIITLKEPNEERLKKIMDRFNTNKIAYRRGVAGGGNQLRQPYIRGKGYGSPEDFPVAEYIHFNALYIGNHQNINEENIKDISDLLNGID